MGSLFSKPTPAVKPRDEGRILAAAKHIEAVKEDLVALQQQIEGDVYFPSDDEAYHQQRERPYYLNDANYPAAIICPKNAQDVAAAIQAIQKIKDKNEKEYVLGVAGGCHSHYCMVEQAIVIDLGKYMTEARVDAQARTITLQGGAKIQVGNNALKGTGLGFVTGTNGDTGVSGLTLAGGAGYLAGQAGYACDTVTKAQVVLPSGDIVTATDDNEHKDLLRALRGGGGNFGVVTEWTFKLFDVTNAFAGTVVHFAPTMARLTIVMDNFAKVIEELPDQGCAICVLPTGAPVFISLYSMIGDSVKDARTYTDVPFLAKASNLGAWFRMSNDLGRKDYHDVICPMLEPVQQRLYGIIMGVMVYAFDKGLRDTLIHFARVDHPGKGTKATILAQFLSGEMRRNDGSRSSIRHRKAVAWIIIEGGWEPDATEEQIQSAKDWAHRVKKKVLELGGEDGPHNFCDTDGRRIKFFTEEQRAFLEQAKKKYDPKNLFALNKNIGYSE